MPKETPLFPELTPAEPPRRDRGHADATSGSPAALRTGRASKGSGVPGSPGTPDGPDAPGESEESGASDADAPLAHRLRPRSFDEFEGQLKVIGPGRPLRRAIESGSVGSIVLWGPPGCGKTTLAKLIARHTDRRFVTFSAVTEGVPRVREIIAEAKRLQAEEGRGTILFCDEIHRFNKAQQDAFLPHVETGAITLIGATTENPSFELNAALLSRVRVFALEPLTRDDTAAIVSRALAALASGDSADLDSDDDASARDRAAERASDAQGEIGPAAPGEAATAATMHLTDDAIDVIATHADGDARRALNATEALWEYLQGTDNRSDVTAETVAAALERRVARFDKNGEEHFNQISALHKAVRGSDVEGALYWLARMLAGGEDPMYLLRRLVRMATEDIGLTDPRALSITLAAKDTFHFLGPPEGELAIAEAVIYLATAPKSNRVYQAWNAARSAAETYPAEPVPMAVRNAPTGLMRELGYGKGYRYDHDEGGFAAGQQYLPEALEGARWYEPTSRGFEKTLAERLDWWRKMKEAQRNE